MKVAVSLPEGLFEQADDAAARLGVTRSALYARALESFLAQQGADPVTARLNELARDLDAVDGAAAARRLIDAGKWEW